jgi:hypothetical protein
MNVEATNPGSANPLAHGEPDDDPRGRARPRTRRAAALSAVFLAGALVPVLVGGVGSSGSAGGDTGVPSVPAGRAGLHRPPAAVVHRHHMERCVARLIAGGGFPYATCAGPSTLELA